MNQRHRAVSCALVALLGACSGPADVSCPGHSQPNMALTVIDSRSRATIDSRVTLVWTRNGTVADSLVTPIGTQNDNVGILVTLAPGVYDLVVRKAGYVDWTRTGVLLDAASAPCDPASVTVIATLQRLP